MERLLEISDYDFGEAFVRFIGKQYLLYRVRTASIILPKKIMAILSTRPLPSAKAKSVKEQTEILKYISEGEIFTLTKKQAYRALTHHVEVFYLGNMSKAKHIRLSVDLPDKIYFQLESVPKDGDIKDYPHCFDGKLVI